MLSLLGAVVELVDLRNGQLVFRSNRNYPEGKQVDVRLALPPGSGKVTTLSVEIVNCRPLVNGGLLYTARVLTDVPQLTLSNPLQDPALRRSPRHAVQVRVMSRDLPAYRAMSLDLSRCGTQLQTDGPLPTGQVLQLTFQFDRQHLADLTCDARVVWCREDGARDRYRMGLEFVPATPQVQAELDRVADFFERRAAADVDRLLDESRRLRQQPAPLPRTQTAPAPLPAPAPPARPRRTAFNIPLQAVVHGLWWDLAGKRLLLILQATNGDMHQLEFPHCQTLRDQAASQGRMSRFLRSSVESELLSRVNERNPGAWKHYQLLDMKGQLILELVSGPCRLPDQG